MTVQEEYIRVQAGFMGRPLVPYIVTCDCEHEYTQFQLNFWLLGGWLQHYGPEYGGRKRTTDQVDGQLAGINCPVIF